MKPPEKMFISKSVLENHTMETYEWTGGIEYIRVDLCLTPGDLGKYFRKYHNHEISIDNLGLTIIGPIKDTWRKRTFQEAIHHIKESIKDGE